MPSLESLGKAAEIVARIASIPIREQSPARPPFWSNPLAVTKARPIPANTDWFDYLILRGGFGFFPRNYSAVVNQFTATSSTDMATSGLEYRFIRDGALFPTQEFNLAPGIELGVDRSASAPWPAEHRRINIIVTNQHYLALQVRNTGVGTPIAIAGLFGWYYPNLTSSDRSSFDASGGEKDDGLHDPWNGPT